MQHAVRIRIGLHALQRDRDRLPLRRDHVWQQLRRALHSARRHLHRRRRQRNDAVRRDEHRRHLRDESWHDDLRLLEALGRGLAGDLIDERRERACLVLIEPFETHAEALAREPPNGAWQEMPIVRRAKLHDDLHELAELRHAIASETHASDAHVDDASRALVAVFERNDDAEIRLHAHDAPTPPTVVRIAA